MSAMDLIKKTTPFIFARIVIYGIFALASVLFLGLMIGLAVLMTKLFSDGALAFIIIMVITLSGILSGLRFLERYVLYMVKVGHIAVLVALINNNEVPDGKGQIEYGKEQVKKNFGSANVAFVVDRMVHRAVKQIQSWLFRIGNFFDFIPAAKNIIGIINKIMSVSLNYIDESILSYIMLRKNEQRNETVWKSACDGVVLYAQSWKGIIKSSIISVIFIYALNIFCFLIVVFPLIALAASLTSDTSVGGTLSGFIAVVAAFAITIALKRAIVDPIVTTIMVNSYQKTIKGLEPAVDLQNKLLGISKRFKELFNRAKEEDGGNLTKIS